MMVQCPNTREMFADVQPSRNSRPLRRDLPCKLCGERHTVEVVTAPASVTFFETVKKKA